MASKLSVGNALVAQARDVLQWLYVALFLRDRVAKDDLHGVGVAIYDNPILVGVAIYDHPILVSRSSHSYYIPYSGKLFCSL